MDVDQLMNTKFRHPFHKGYTIYNGYTVTTSYIEKKEQIDNLEVNEDDIWICTFPKVGTTWIQEMVWMILNNVDFVNGKKPLEVRSPFIDFSIIYENPGFWLKDPDGELPENVKDSISYYKSLKSPLVVKTHLPLDLLPKQISDSVKKPKIIYVIRDPRDACISYYHHCKVLEGFYGTFEEFCELFLSGKILYGPYWKHVLPFWKLKNSKHILIIRFEDMKTNLSQVIRQVSAFLERPLSENQIQVLSEHLSFQSMQNNPAVNKSGIDNLVKKLKVQVQTSNKFKFMRAGKVDEYKTAMTEEMRKKFKEWISNNIQETDYFVKKN